MPETKSRKQRHRTYARNRPRQRLIKNFTEADSTYFLKLVAVVLLGTFWLKFKTQLSWQGILIGAFPLGALIAIVGIKLLEKDQYDRKIWFAVLLVITIICYFEPAGVVI